MMIFKEVFSALERYQHFLISTHVNPDPDALCSEVSMAMFLKGLGKKVTILNEAPVPERFRFLPGIKMVQFCETRRRVHYEAAVILDCGDIKRIGKVREYLKQERPVVNIDHHVTNTNFGDINCVPKTASSTCEVLYEMLHEGRHALSKSMAMHLYSGMMTDTGSFRYENTTARTHVIAAHLLTYGFSPQLIYRRLYEMIPLQDIEAFTKIVNRFDAFFDGQVISVKLSKRMVAKFSKDFDLRDTLFKFLRSIQGAEVVVIFTEAQRQVTRINFRSMERVDVAELAAHFGGGGHKRASGCQMEVDMKSAQKIILDKLKRLV